MYACPIGGTFFDELCLIIIGFDRGQLLESELSWIHYDYRYFGQGLDAAGRFDGYVPEQRIFLVAFALGYRSYNHGCAQETWGKP